MLSKNCGISKITVMQSTVSAQMDVPVQRLKQAGNWFYVVTMDHRAFMFDVET